MRKEGKGRKGDWYKGGRGGKEGRREGEVGKRGKKVVAIFEKSQSSCWLELNGRLRLGRRINTQGPGNFE